MTSEARQKIGLVLSGGGAKGAYQVGVLRALAELEIPVDVVAGASIGALNGAMVSVNRDLRVASEKLEALWTELGQSSPLQLNANYLMFLAAWGATLGARLNPVGMLMLTAAELGRGAASMRGIDLGERLETSLSKLGPIRKILESNINSEGIAAGLDYYVSVFPAASALSDVGGYLSSAMGLAENQESEFLLVKSLPKDQQQQAVLASAALPLIFEAQTVNGRAYRDGGMGGNMRVQGNTPADPLVAAGCSHLIVTHLSDGSLWSRAQYPNTAIIEIRPSEKMQRHRVPGVDMVSFDPAVIQGRIKQGFADAMTCIEPIREAFMVRSLRTKSAKLRDQAVRKSEDAIRRLDDDDFSARFEK